MMNIWLRLTSFLQGLLPKNRVEVAIEPRPTGEAVIDTQEAMSAQTAEDGIQWETFSTEHVKEFKRRGLANRPKQ